MMYMTNLTNTMTDYGNQIGAITPLKLAKKYALTIMYTTVMIFSNNILKIISIIY